MRQATLGGSGIAIPQGQSAVSDSAAAFGVSLLAGSVGDEVGGEFVPAASAETQSTESKCGRGGVFDTSSAAREGDCCTGGGGFSSRVRLCMAAACSCGKKIARMNKKRQSHAFKLLMDELGAAVRLCLPIRNRIALTFSPSEAHLRCLRRSGSRHSVRRGLRSEVEQLQRELVGLRAAVARADSGNPPPPAEHLLHGGTAAAAAAAARELHGAEAVLNSSGAQQATLRLQGEHRAAAGRHRGQAGGRALSLRWAWRRPTAAVGAAASLFRSGSWSFRLNDGCGALC